MSYAILSAGRITCRAIPTKLVAARIAATGGGKVITDPRGVSR